MKKKISLLCIALMLLVFSVGCSKKTNNKNAADNEPSTEDKQQVTIVTDEEQEEEKPVDEENEVQKVDVRVASLKGPTSLGLLQMIRDADTDTLSNNYNFEMFAAADEILTKVVKGEVDIALVPANVAAVLYQKTNQKVCVVDVNTLGVLYAVERGENIKTVSDLKGKTICMTGKGTVPEHALSYLLSKNGLSMDDVNIEFKSEPTEVVAFLSSKEDAIGILPQPFVTAAMVQDDTLRIALDFTAEWKKVDTESTFITGVTIVRKEFLSEHEEVVKQFVSEHGASVEYTNTNVDDAATIAESLEIVKAPVAKRAIPFCNIVCIQGEEMKQQLSGYLQTLFDAKAESVGGTLPDEGFYYTGTSEK